MNETGFRNVGGEIRGREAGLPRDSVWKSVTGWANCARDCGEGYMYLDVSGKIRGWIGNFAAQVLRILFPYYFET